MCDFMCEKPSLNLMNCQQIKSGSHLERAKGIEPSWPAWKAGTLPLSYARVDRTEMQNATKSLDLKSIFASSSGSKCV
jgi:hypothetical protein